MEKRKKRSCLKILLAAYNGQKYIAAQLDGIGKSASQYTPHYKIQVSDDHSTDGTISAIKSSDFISKIEIKRPIQRCGTALLNFSFLLKDALNVDESDYYMLSDQDDVWCTNKVSLSMKKMHELEEIYGEDTPVLIFTDASVVDEALNIIASSFWENESLNPSLAKNFKVVCVHNVVQGATVLFNRSLLHYCGAVPAQARMHDHWLTMAASSVGVIGFLPNKTIKYRQHSGNIIGSHKVTLWGAIGNMRHSLKKADLSLQASKVQAEAFLEHFGDSIPSSKRHFLEDFIKIKDEPFWVRKRFVFKHKLFLGTYIRTVGLLAVI